MKGVLLFQKEKQVMSWKLVRLTGLKWFWMFQNRKIKMACKNIDKGVSVLMKDPLALKFYLWLVTSSSNFRIKPKFIKLYSLLFLPNFCHYLVTSVDNPNFCLVIKKEFLRCNKERMNDISMSSQPLFIYGIHYFQNSLCFILDIFFLAKEAYFLCIVQLLSCNFSYLCQPFYCFF